MKKIIFLTLLNFLIYSQSFAEKDIKNWELKYSLSNIENFGAYLSSISIEYIKDYTLIYTRELAEFDYQSPMDLIEYYKNNYYVLLGKGKYEEKILGIEYTLKTITFGIKISSYKDIDVLFYKLQKDYYLKNESMISARVIAVDANEVDLNYMLEFRYKIFKYSYYFDFENTNKGVAEIELKNINNKYSIKAGYGQDFKTMDNGLMLTIGMKF